MVKILWVEEEGKTTLMHYKVPMVRAGYIVDTVESVTEAVELLKMADYDALIIDLLLPGGRAFESKEKYLGIEMIEIAKKMGMDTKRMMVLTVVNDEEVHERIRKLGVKKIVVKGMMEINDLKRHVDELLQ